LIGNFIIIFYFSIRFANFSARRHFAVEVAFISAPPPRLLIEGNNRKRITFFTYGIQKALSFFILYLNLFFIA